MYVWLNLKTIKFYLLNLATDFYWQPCYLQVELALLITAVKISMVQATLLDYVTAGNTKWGIVTVPLTSFLTGLDRSVFQIITNIVSCQNRWFQTSQTGGNRYNDIVFPGRCLHEFTGSILLNCMSNFGLSLSVYWKNKRIILSKTF